MEERMSLRSALSTAWGNLTGVNNEGNIRIYRWLLFGILLLGALVAGWYYLQGQEIVALEEFAPGPLPNQAQADQKRLDTMVQQVEVTSAMRQGSPEVVRMTEETFGKYPFREPRMGPDIVDDPQILGDLPPVVIDYPPEMVLRAIMIMGNQHVAVMDIPGVGTGMIVKPGYTFMQRKGRVVRIALDKVVVNWGGRNWDIAPSF